MAKKNSSILWTVEQTGDSGIGKDGRDQAQKNVGLDTLYSGLQTGDRYYVKYRIDLFINKRGTNFW